MVLIATAAPVIQSVQNAASNVPYRSLALGGIFVIKGTGLGPANISIDAKPLPEHQPERNIEGKNRSHAHHRAQSASVGTALACRIHYHSDKRVKWNPVSAARDVSARNR